MKLIALDIETITINADDFIESELQKEKGKLLSKMNADILNAKTKYVREETQAKHIATAETKYEEACRQVKDKIQKKLIGDRRFTQVICIGLAFRSQNGIIHRWFYDENEKDVLTYFAKWVNENVNPDDRFVTFNGDGFDLPQLIAAFSRTDTSLNCALNSRQFIDLMKYPFERFLPNSKLDLVADIYGVKVPDQDRYKVEDFEDVELDGSYVFDMHRLDKLDNLERVPAYCNQDTYKTLRMAEEIQRFIDIR